MDDGGRIYRNWNEQPLFVDIVPARYFLRNPNIVRTRGALRDLIEPKDMTVWPVRADARCQPRLSRRACCARRHAHDIRVRRHARRSTAAIDCRRSVHGDAFITESAGNLVHRLKIVDDGNGRLTRRTPTRRASSSRRPTSASARSTCSRRPTARSTSSTCIAASFRTAASGRDYLPQLHQEEQARAAGRPRTHLARRARDGRSATRKPVAVEGDAAADWSNRSRIQTAGIAIRRSGCSSSAARRRSRQR